MDNIKNKLGDPDKVDEKGWSYNLDNLPKLWLGTENKILTSVSLSAWDGDPYKKVEYVLGKFSGEWDVIKEPMSNPHAGRYNFFIYNRASRREN